MQCLFDIPAIIFNWLSKIVYNALLLMIHAYKYLRTFGSTPQLWSLVEAAETNLYTSPFTCMESMVKGYAHVQCML